MEIIHDLNFFIPIAIGLFWTIIFTQSGLDKIMDFKGNLSWLESHFAKTFLRPLVKPMLLTVMVIELLAGLISLFGIVNYLMTGSKFWISQGLILSIISLLMLIFGQRIAKDYDGAKTIAIYFGIALLSGLFLIN